MSQENKNANPVDTATEQKVVPMVKPVAAKAPAKPVKKSVAKKTKAKKRSAKKAAPKKVTSKKSATKKPAAAKKKAVRAPKLITASKPQTPTFAGSTSSKAMEKMMTKTKTQFDGYMKETNDTNRESYDAFVKSSTLFAKGFEDIFKVSMSLAQSAAEKQKQFMKEAMGSKTLNEFTEVQNKMTQANFDDFMSGATKISELSVKLLSESAEPMNEQMSKSMNKVAKAA